MSLAFLPVLGLVCASLQGGTLRGAVRDLNWFARYQDQPYGVGLYEYAVNAAGFDSAGQPQTAGAATDVFGQFSAVLPGGTYQVASWSVWWRPALAFNVVVPARTASAPVDLRLRGTMWGYPAFWDNQGYTEFGQLFVASGPLSMILLRCPNTGRNLRYTLTVHEGGPGGLQVGESRGIGEGDQRPIYGWGQMPTVADQLYYLRVRCSTPGAGVVMQMDPRPDNVDPMPGGCLYLGDGVAQRAYPDRDLGVVLMADDDGLLTNWHARGDGSSWSGTSIGQSFVARGTSLVAAGFWLADPSAPTYAVQLYADGPGGTAIGPLRLGRPPRVTADPEMLVVWAPGECPLDPGRTYYLEVTRSAGGTFNVAYVNTSDPFAFGQGYRNGGPIAGADLAGLTMEEASSGSALAQGPKIVEGPEVIESDRGTREIVVRWRTDEPTHGTVEAAPNDPPYLLSGQGGGPITDHASRLAGLQPNTVYHYRVRSTAASGRTVVSRDHVTLTRPIAQNLLLNPGFEEGSGGSPRKPVTHWVTGGSSLDIGASDGTWFWGLPPHEGGWLLEGAVNGSSADGFIAQRVAVSPGTAYTFSAWVTTWMRENNTWKYDVWNDRNRLSWVRLGLDFSGGVDPNAASVQWTPRFYSHLRYTVAAVSGVASGSQVTAFVQMRGSGGQWHLFGVDECTLTEQAPALPQVSIASRQPDGTVLVRAQVVPPAPVGLEYSHDLVSWDPWTNSPSPEGWIEWLDTAPSELPQRFYRAIVP